MVEWKRGRHGQIVGVAGLLLAVSLPAPAQEGAWRDWLSAWQVTGSLSAGVGVRLQDPKPSLIGKSNLDPALCRDDACISQTGDPEPNQRLVDAPGLFTVSSDDAQLNYAGGDLTSAPVRGTLELFGQWGEWSLKVGGLGFYDFVNADFTETNFNTDFQPARERRTRRVEKVVGRRVDLRDAALTGLVDIPGLASPLFVSVGQQTLRWGEASILVLNSLAEWTPPDVTLLTQPGIALSEVFQPVPLFSAGMALTDRVQLDVIYQFGWRPVRLPPVGSFFSFNDIVEGEDFSVGFGNFPEDPERLYRQPGLAQLASNSSRTAFIAAQDEPRHDGQFGAKLGLFTDWLGGTEIGLYFARTHSRLPIFSSFAAEESCARQTPTPNALTVLVACGGFTGGANPFAGDGVLAPLAEQVETLIGNGQFDAVLDLLAPFSGGGSDLLGEELIRVDSMRPFLEYPEDVTLYGLSFNTTLGGWSVVGEIAHRPDQPLQISPRDVVFAALGPGLPAEPLPLGPITINGESVSVPDFLSVFRGIEINGGDRIAGFERFAVTQLMLGGLYQFGPRNPFWAESVTVLPEVGATYVDQLPDIAALQISAGAPAATHASPGADGTGDPSGEPNTVRINPTQTSDLFATPWSWGARLAMVLEYPRLLPFDWGLKVTTVGFWDIEGRGPLPIENFVEGRKQLSTALEVRLADNLSSTLAATIFTGGGGASARRDRDFAAFSVRWTF